MLRPLLRTLFGSTALVVVVVSCQRLGSSAGAIGEPRRVIDPSPARAGHSTPRSRCLDRSPSQIASDGCSAEWLWGVTVDDVTSLDDVVESLRSFSVRPTARVVFDEGQPAAYYQAPLAAIHGVADVMGEVLDSQFAKRLTVDAYQRRARDYVEALGHSVDIWEVGNEVNGDWLGATPDVVAKISAAFLEIERRGHKTALTLYYNEGCTDAEHEMFTWTAANVPESMRRRIDYVLVSYYEDDCGGRIPTWGPVFDRLGAMFPSAALGFGECGTDRTSEKRDRIVRWYGTRVDHPRFVGGYFWWYFRQDMVPRTRPLWSVLDGVMRPR